MLARQTPPAGSPRPGEPGEAVASTRAMATEVRLRVPGGAGDPCVEAAIERAFAAFAAVERSCTRFEPSSALMRANAAPGRFHAVPAECLLAIRLAHRAYEATAGWFDPRVLDDLVGLGYDRTLGFSAGGIAFERPPHRRSRLGAWRPRFRGADEVDLGPHRVDLGGIGKGLAIRLGAAALVAAGVRSFLLEAGGDCLCRGQPGEAGPWLVGVEDPDSSGDGPLAVLALSDRACATSSVRVRRWTTGGQHVHHLIDPRTGLPGGDGLAAVTVVERDPAWAEVWSKSLLLAGPARVAGLAERRAIAALWADDLGRWRASRAMEHYLVWRSPAGEAA